MSADELNSNEAQRSRNHGTVLATVLAVLAVLAAAIAWTAYAALVNAGWPLTGSGGPGNGERAEPTLSYPLPASSITASWPYQDLAALADLGGEATTWPTRKPTELWRRSLGEGYSSPVVSAGRLVLFHRQGDEEIIDCVDAATGEPLWDFRYPTAYECPVSYSSGPYSSPVVSEGRVYTIGAEGRLHCIDLATGDCLWGRSLHQEYGVRWTGFYPVAASPLIDGNRLVLNLGAGESMAGILALDKDSGETLWTATDHGASHATAIAATFFGRRMVLAWTAEALVALEPEQGQVLWQIPFSARNPEVIHATSPIVYGHLVFVSGYSLGSLCVEIVPSGGYRRLWQDSTVLDSQYHNLVCVDGRVFGMSSLDRTFRCIDLRSGQLLWKFRWRSGRGAWAIPGRSRLLLWGESGQLGVIATDPSGAQYDGLSDRPLLKGPCYPAPAFSEGRFYLRNGDTLLCLAQP